MSTANVTSIDAVRGLKGALHQFSEEVQSALIQLDIESRRAVEWIENDRSRYWPAEERKAATAVSEARTALERAELNIDGETRYRHEERKVLEKAKRRQRLAEEKVAATRRWKLQIQKEVETFQVQLAKLQHFFEADFPQALAALERINAALDRYVQRASGPASPEAALPTGNNSAKGGAE